MALAASVAAAWVALDQITKTIVLRTIDEGEVVPVFWTLQLGVFYNSGVAFSLGRGSGAAVAPLALAVVVAVVFVGRHLRGRLAGLVLGMVIGGAIGNLVDRLLRDHDGAVVDFIDLQWFPVFNVADIGVVCGGIALGLLSLRDDRPAPPSPPEPEPEPELGSDVRPGNQVTR